MVKKDLGALVRSIGAPAPSPVPETTEDTKPATPSAETPSVDEAPTPVTKTSTRQPAARKSAQATAPVGEEEPGTSDVPATAGIQVMISQELNDRLQAYLAKRKISHAKLLLEAIEKTYKRLPQLIADDLGAEDEEEDDDDRVFLFERPARERQQAAGAPRAKHHVRVTPKNRQMLDTIAEQVGAPSRNRMITVVYDAYLPQLTTES